MAGKIITAVNGSERRGGNTSWLLEHVSQLAAARDVLLDVVELSTARISRCGSCGDCNSRPEPCIINDDMPEIIARMVAADALIYAAPVHGYGVSSLMQQFIERAGVGYLRFERPLTNKVAGVIVTGRRYGHVDVHAQLLHNVLLNRMIIVGSGFPAVVHAGGRHEAVNDLEGVNSVNRMVDRMIDMIELLDRHRIATGQTLPTPHTTEGVAS